MKKVHCENCVFWNPVDPALIQRCGNRGACTFMLARKADSYARGPVPFWAARMVGQTVSWEGEGCPSHKPCSTREAKRRYEMGRPGKS